MHGTGATVCSAILDESTDSLATPISLAAVTDHIADSVDAWQPASQQHSHSMIKKFTLGIPNLKGSSSRPDVQNPRHPAGSCTAVKLYKVSDIKVRLAKLRKKQDMK